MLCGVRPFAALEARRRDFGLDVGAEAQRVADVRRTLMAATSPAFLKSEGDPRYLAAALRHAVAGLA